MEQMLLIFLGLLFGVLLVVFREKVKQYDKTISIILGILILISRIWRGSGYVIDGEWQKLIPLQLCSFTTYLTMFYFLFNIKKLEPYIFFFGFLALTSFIDPTLSFGEDRISYIYGFTLDHIIIVLMPLYLVLIRGFKYSVRDVFKPYILMMILMLIAWPTNYLMVNIGQISNYFELTNKPVMSDVISANSMNKYLHDFVFIICFNLAFVIINLINFSLLFGVRKLTNDQVKTFWSNKIDS